ncbi:hypothetical protein PV367_27400 [Streptomyces europaeiscabiei]|uniref:Uncharacterized protein n=1 Tax=Streptomyces europaeiscabiei TaxID=146819 RepID=A0AAJ2UNC0_9ACTN|nr:MULTISPECIES: hypothetical protein [Streptomyces]MDX3133423.1 hypothetical protein [Streptomyces europaeiscabiei]
MVVWEMVGAAVQFAAGHLVRQALGPLGLALLITALVACKVGQVHPAWWAALLFLLLMVQA